MKRALLDRLLEYRRAKCPAALVVDLASGRQTLVTDHAVFGDLPLSEHQLDLACRAALDDEFASASGQYFDNDAGRYFAVVDGDHSCNSPQ